MVVADTWWASIPIFQTVAVAKLGIKGPLEYLQVSATTLMSLLFIYMIPIDCKIFLTKRPASKFSKMVRDLLAEIP